jgi:hypothetical protein
MRGLALLRAHQLWRADQDNLHAIRSAFDTATTRPESIGNLAT